MENNGVVELVEMLYQIVTEAWGIPLGADKCVVERDRVLDILDEIKEHLPKEIEESKKLISARTEYIANAKREAESIRKLAEEHARQMVDDQEVVKTAKDKSSQLLTSAEAKSTELRKLANDYADDALKRTESAIESALEEVRRSRGRFKSASSAQLRGPAPAIPEDEEL